MVDSERYQQHLERAQRLRRSGLDLESTLGRLRSEGATIMESCKIVRVVEDVSLGEAKRIIDSSATWADRLAANEALRDDLWKAFEEEAAERDGRESDQ